MHAYIFQALTMWFCISKQQDALMLQILMDPMILSVLYVWCQLNKDQIVSFWFGTRFKVCSSLKHVQKSWPLLHSLIIPFTTANPEWWNTRLLNGHNGDNVSAKFKNRPNCSTNFTVLALKFYHKKCQVGLDSFNSHSLWQLGTYVCTTYSVAFISYI